MGVLLEEPSALTYRGLEQTVFLEHLALCARAEIDVRARVDLHYLVDTARVRQVAVREHHRVDIVYRQAHTLCILDCLSRQSRVDKVVSAVVLDKKRHALLKKQLFVYRRVFDKTNYPQEFSLTLCVIADR